MGYWILMAMLVVAVVAVVAALALDFPRTRQWPGATDGTMRWLAIVPACGVAAGDWAARLAGAIPESVASEVAAAPGPMLTDIIPIAQRAATERPPDVLLFWSALDDVLAGIPIDEHERALHAALEDLGASGVTAVVGNVPDLSRLPAAIEAGLPADELRLLSERWNGAIERLAHHHGALVADLFDVSPRLGDRDGPPDAGGDGAVIAERFLPVLRQALVRARRQRVAADGELPL